MSYTQSIFKILFLQLRLTCGSCWWNRVVFTTLSSCDWPIVSLLVIRQIPAGSGAIGSLLPCGLTSRGNRDKLPNRPSLFWPVSRLYPSRLWEASLIRRLNYSLEQLGPRLIKWSQICLFVHRKCPCTEVTSNSSNPWLCVDIPLDCRLPVLKWTLKKHHHIVHVW